MIDHYIDTNDDDNTDLWDANLQISHQVKQSIPKLDDWFAVSKADRTILSGIIYGHHKIEDGRRISTSTVKDFQADDNGKLYLVTQNSRYELGKQLILEDMESCFGKETQHANKD